MNSNMPLNKKNRGFTLIELAVVMAVMGLLIAGLFQLTTTSARTIQDQATAQQLQQYIRASKAYLSGRMNITPGTPATVSIGIASDAADLPANIAVNSVTNITARVNNYRTGLPTTSPLGSGYTVRLRRLTDVATATGNEPMFTLGVFMTGGVTLPRPQLGNIAALIGSEGAGVYDGATMGEADVAATTGCNEAGTTIRAAFASLCVNASFMDGGLGLPESERPAALAYGSPSDFSSSASQWLSRTFVNGAPQMTTMSADLVMGAGGAGTNDITMTDATNSIIMMGGSIRDDSGAAGINPVVVNDTLRLSAAASNLVLNGGNINDLAGPVIIGDALSITGASMALNGTIVGPGGVGGIQGITFFNGASQIPLVAGTVGAEQNLGITGSLSVSGTLRAASFVYSSDERLKKNIVELDNALGKLEKVRGVQFEYKKGGKETLGVIAQDVEKAYPQLIDQDADGYKMVNYNGLIGPVIEALHELAAENKKLRERVEQLEKSAAHGKH